MVAIHFNSNTGPDIDESHFVSLDLETDGAISDRHDARRLTRSKIQYVTNKSFDAIGTGASIFGQLANDGLRPSKSPGLRPTRGFPAHLARLCEDDLLSGEQERRLFQMMNYLKYLASSLRETLDPEYPQALVVAQAERFLEEADAIRDQIVRSNMRLVVSIVKKFVTPQISFDELLSEGIETLMKVVNKFDYDRGFRFSTYAYRAIARTMLRMIGDVQRENNRFVTGLDETFFDAPDAPEDRDPWSLDERTWNKLRDMLSQMLDKLDRRERLIIRARFGLGSYRKPRTCQAIGEKLGISKERVRQVEWRAVAKLRRIAEKVHLAQRVEPGLLL